MGKSWVRFRSLDDRLVDLIGGTIGSIGVAEFVALVSPFGRCRG